jgi:hypothetical protein
MQQIDLAHHPGEPVERSKGLTNEQKIESQHHDEARQQEHELLDPDRGMQRHRCEPEQREGQREHRGVCREHAPQHRQRPSSRSRAMIPGRRGLGSGGDRGRDVEAVAGHGAVGGRRGRQRDSVKDAR